MIKDNFTFTDKSGRWRLTVKKTFLLVCEEPWKHDAYDLNLIYLIFSYLHNTRGPAVISILDGREEYWLHGRISNKDVIETNLFNDKILEIIA